MDLNKENPNQLVNLVNSIQEDKRKVIKICFDKKEDESNIEEVNCIDHNTCLEAQIERNKIHLELHNEQVRKDSEGCITYSENGKLPIVCLKSLQDISGDHLINCVSHEKCLFAQVLQHEKMKSCEVLKEVEAKYPFITSRSCEMDLQDDFEVMGKLNKDEIMSNFSDILETSTDFIERFPRQNNFKKFGSILIWFLMIFLVLSLFNQTYCNKNHCKKEFYDIFCARTWFDPTIIY